MINLTTLSGDVFYINADLIYKVEGLADTLITLVDNKTLRVKESPEEIKNLIIHYKRKIYIGDIEG